MTLFSPETLQAFVDIELTVLASLFRSAPLGALVLLAAVMVAVGWLSWTEAGTYRAHHPHAKA
jgi:hypothetical protein